LGDIREICGNEDSFERNGDGIHGSHSASLVQLSNGRPRFVLSGCTTKQGSGPDLGWL
jgi:hypothetical protein